MKPLASLNRPVLGTVDVVTKEETVSFKERTDVHQARLGSWPRPWWRSCWPTRRPEVRWRPVEELRRNHAAYLVARPQD